MMTLPPLLTVRRNPADDMAATPSPAAAGIAIKATAPSTPVPALDVPGLPLGGRQALAELLNLGVLTSDDLAKFFEKVGDRIGQLASRDRTLDALAGLKFLTHYVVTRLLAGLTHGLVFGGYRVLDRMSSGSIGIVFRAEHVQLRRPAAIKAMPLDETTRQDTVDRFFNEVRMLAKVNHPHVVAVFDAGTLAETGPGMPATAYLVMELLDGGDLENHVYEHGTPDLGTACEWIRQAAMGLRAAHAEGFIHRDVKPSNLLLSAQRTIKVIDFGLARDFAGTRTNPKSLLGSLEFLAPEQLADAPLAIEPADVYGLGATLFWLLSGQLPYPQQTLTSAAIAAIRTGTPSRLRDVKPEMPVELDALLARMLSRSPSDRPSMARVAVELGAFASAVHTDEVLNTEPERLRQSLRHVEGLVRTTAMQADLARSAVLAALTAAAARRPGESAAHQNRVAAYTHLLACGLSVDPDWILYSDSRSVTELCRAAALHDLGLIAVPDDLLEPGVELSASEQFAYERHTQAADEILDELGRDYGDALPFLRAVRAVARSHHERWDGGGFPDRLKEDCIPPAARIVALAVAYDDQRCDGIVHADAVAQIRSESGTAYDPAVVECFRSSADEFDRIHADGK